MARGLSASSAVTQDRAFMASKYRSWILPAIVLVILLATAPSAIHRVVETETHTYLPVNSLTIWLRACRGRAGCASLCSPSLRILLGTRDGVKDARAGSRPFLWGLVFHRELRGQLLRSGLASVRNLVAIAILLDIISQYLIFHEIHPGAAVLLGPVLIALPYALARAFANRIARRRGHDLADTSTS
jgi:hypothetical protein